MSHCQECQTRASNITLNTVDLAKFARTAAREAERDGRPKPYTLRMLASLRANLDESRHLATLHESECEIAHLVTG